MINTTSMRNMGLRLMMDTTLNFIDKASLQRNEMTKDDVLDLILKAMAVYLFVLAVMALPVVVGALLQMIVFSKSTLAALSGDATLGESFMATRAIAGADGVLRFVFYILVGRNLFSGGSWARRILVTRNTTQTNDAAALSGSDPPSLNS